MPSLRSLCEAGRQPVLVVTQPARPQGRGRRLQQPPVAQWALGQGLELMQPRDVRAVEFLEDLRRIEPTVAVVVAFGQIFPRDLLELPEHGCINVHASLLPRYRGAAPIQAAIVAGDQVTGITTMMMEEGLDTGPILLRREVEIGAEETGGELAERLAVVGAELLLETLTEAEAGRLQSHSQPEEGVSVARRLRRDDGVIDWTQPAARIFALLRGLTPWPGCTTTLRGQSVKILWGRPLAADDMAGGEPGTFQGLRGDLLVVSCGQSTFFGIERVQKPGRQGVPAKAFYNGERLEVGEPFG